MGNCIGWEETPGNNDVDSANETVLNVIFIGQEAVDISSAIQALSKYTSPQKQSDLSKSIQKLRNMITFAPGRIKVVADVSICRCSIDLLVEAASSLMKIPSLFSYASSVLSITNLFVIILTSSLKGEGQSVGDISLWQHEVKKKLSNASSYIRNSPMLSKSNDITLSVILHEFTLLELGIICLPDPKEKGKIIGAGVSVLIGAAKSALKMSVDEQLLKGISSLVTVEAQSLRRMASIPTYNLLKTLVNFNSQIIYEISPPKGREAANISSDKVIESVSTK